MLTKLAFILFAFVSFASAQVCPNGASYLQIWVNGTPSCVKLDPNTFNITGGVLSLGGMADPHAPALPQSQPNSTYPVITGVSTAVHAGDNLQAIINTAGCGDELVLDKGATFEGNYTLPNKGCTSSHWVAIRSSGARIARGTRATAWNLPDMATICTANSNPAVANLYNGNASARAAAYYWFEGIEIAPCANFTGVLWNAVLLQMPTNLVMPKGAPQDATVANMPHDIAFSHTYIHGVPNQDYMTRGLFLDGYNYTVIDSTLNQWQSSGLDSQAIYSDCGTGNILIQNNDIEAAGDSILFAAPQCALVPTDISVLGNYFTQQSAWSPKMILKNFIEFKNGKRIKIDGNVIAFGHVGGQPGTGIALTPRTETGGEPAGTWATTAEVSDVTVTHNVIHDTGMGIIYAGQDSYCYPAMSCVHSSRVLIQNNLIYNIDLVGASDWPIQLDFPIDVTVDHNTALAGGGSHFSLFLDAVPSVNTSVTNNIFNLNVGGQGVFGPSVFSTVSHNGGLNWMTTTQTQWFGTGLVMSPTSPFAETVTYSLVPGSKFAGAGTDSKDLGWDPNVVNIAAVTNGAR